MSAPQPPDDPPRRPRRRRFPDDAEPGGVPAPDPDPLDEPDDLLAPEDDDEDDEDGPEPSPSELEDMPRPEEDDGEPPASPDAGEGPPSDLEELDHPWLDDGSADDDDDDELPPLGLDDSEPFPLDDEDDDPSTWPDVELAQPVPLEQPFDWADPEEDLGGPGVTEDDWSTLEVDEAGLLPGRVVVGLKEFAALPDLGLGEVVARFDTGVERSRLACLSGDRATLAVGDHVIGAPPDERTLRTRVEVAGCTRTLVLELTEAGEDPPLVLGRDALEGYFVIDVALAFLHARSAGMKSPSSSA